MQARVRVDGGQVYAPALQQFPGGSQTIGTPSVRTGWRDDVYLTLSTSPDADGDAVTLRRDRRAADRVAVDRRRHHGHRHGARRVPGGRRRRPIDPVSAPVPERRVQPTATDPMSPSRSRPVVERR